MPYKIICLLHSYTSKTVLLITVLGDATTAFKTYGITSGGWLHMHELDETNPFPV